MPFAPDALAANQRGELTDTQRAHLRAMVRSDRRSQLSFGAVVIAASLLVLLYSPKVHADPARMALAVIALVIGVIVLVRALSGHDAVSRDIRAGRVDCAEGAIGKRQGSGRTRASTPYFLDVGARTFSVSPRTYDEAPDAGHVRVYYLPASRRVVNLELRPDLPIDPATVTRQGLMAALGAAMHAHGRVDRNEARAEAAGVAHAFEAMMSGAPPPEHLRDPRPLAQAIVGGWSNGFVTIAFAADGTATARIGGREHRGQWSIDGSGRLHAEVAGQRHAADAWVAGDELTLAEGGQGMKLRRG